MSHETVHPVSADWVRRAWCDDARYQAMYRRSLDDPDGFWGEQAKRLDWIKPFTRVKNTTFDGKVAVKWFEDGVLNASYNCLDRNVERGLGGKTAIIFEADDGKVTKVSPQPLTGQHTLALARAVMNDKQAAEFEKTKECNFAISPQGIGRFRCNAFVQQGQVGLVMRTIPQTCRLWISTIC